MANAVKKGEFHSLRRRTSFYWSLMWEVWPHVAYVTKHDMLAAWSLVRMKTHSHELFHYYFDVLRRLFGGVRDPLREEALAVAWARMCIQKQRNTWNSAIGRMNGLMYSCSCGSPSRIARLATAIGRIILTKRGLSPRCWTTSRPGIAGGCKPMGSTLKISCWERCRIVAAGM